MSVTSLQPPCTTVGSPSGQFQNTQSHRLLVGYVLRELQPGWGKSVTLQGPKSSPGHFLGHGEVSCPLCISHLTVHPSHSPRQAQCLLLSRAGRLRELTVVFCLLVCLPLLRKSDSLRTRAVSATCCVLHKGVWSWVHLILREGFREALVMGLKHHTIPSRRNILCYYENYVSVCPADSLSLLSSLVNWPTCCIVTFLVSIFMAPFLQKLYFVFLLSLSPPSPPFFWFHFCCCFGFTSFVL